MIELLAYAAFGAVARVLLGLYKAYREGPVVVQWKRVAVELVASLFFGGFAITLLGQIGLLKWPLEAAALIAGFFGADLLNVVYKKVGAKVEAPVFAMRPELGRVLKFVKKHRRITNNDYQMLAGVSHATATAHLELFASSGYLARMKKGRYTYYMAR